MRVFLLTTMVLAAAGMSGCHHDSDREHSVTSHLSIHGQNVAVHAPGRPDAEISAAGDLAIAGQNVPVAASERDLLKHYHDTALALRDQAITTGKAGIATAGQAISSVASGLASGNPDRIDAEVSAKANKVDASAALICTDLAELRATQETLARQLEAFRPYAVIKADEVEDCPGRRQIRKR